MSHISRLLGSKKTRRRDPASRQLDFVISISWVQKGEKTRSGISSTRLLGSKKARRRDSASRQHDFLGPRRRDVASRQLYFMGPKRREGEIRHLVNSTSWVQEDEKARSGISSSLIHGSKKTRRRDPASRQLDFLGPRSREGEIRHLINSISWVQEGEKTRSDFLSIRLLGSKKARS